MQTVILTSTNEALAFLDRFIFSTPETDPSKMGFFDEICPDDIAAILEIVGQDDDELDDVDSDAWPWCRAQAHQGNCNLMKTEFPCLVVWHLGENWDRIGDISYRIFNIFPLSEISYQAIAKQHDEDIAAAIEDIELRRELSKLHNKAQSH